MDESGDMQQPDEARPTKRVKLEAPLSATEELQEDIADEDDWDNIYDDTAAGTPRENAAESAFLAAVPETADLATTHDLNEDGDGGVLVRVNGDARELSLAEEARLVTEEPSARMLDETTRVEVGSIHTDGQAPKITNSTPVTESALAASGNEDRDEEQDVRDTAEAETATAIATNEMEDALYGHHSSNQDLEFLMAGAAQKDNQEAEWELDSSDAESSDSDSSSEDDSSDDPDSGSEDGYEMLDPATAAKILMSGDGDDDDGDKKNKGGDHQPRTANEVKEAVIPKPDVVVTEDMKITHLGDVDRIVDNLVMIKGATPGEYQVLEVGSVLCNENRQVVGAVADTLGRVQEPFYSVAFSNASEIEEAGLVNGTKLYYVDSHSSFVFTQPLKNMKGTDASNIHDEEVGEDELEFSDDEEEQEYKRQRKAAKRGGRGNLSRSAFNEDRAARSFGAPGHDSGQTWVSSSDAPPQQYGGGLSYDDDGDAPDEFYSPLKRPDNLSQLMAGGNLPPRPPQSFHDRGRGRGRGFDRGGRGRGDRGRGDRGRGRGGFDKRGGRGGHNQDRSNRGGQGGQNGFRGNAHSFPDRHNHEPTSPQRHTRPTQSSSSPQSHPQQAQYQQQQQQQQQPQTYQFNGYTFQYGIPPPQPSAGYYNQPPSSSNPVGPMYNQQMQGQWQQQQPAHGGWQGQQQQPTYGYAQPTASQAGQQQLNLAEIMKQFGGYQQPQQR